MTDFQHLYDSNTYMIDTLHKIAFAALQNYNNF